MNIYLTLDYELFSGNPVGTPENCIVRPMTELDKVAEKWGVKYVLFVDAANLLKLEQYSSDACVKRDYDLWVENMRYLEEKGHDIQMHFHPQWMYSSYEKGTWKVDTSHFKLSDMDEGLAVSSFLEAKICLEKAIGHPVYAFRAGGYCLDTFPKYIELFKKAAISIDSSVARHRQVKSKVHEYDYRQIPQKQVYSFSSSVKEEDEDGMFTEMSIASVRENMFERFLKIKKLTSTYNPTVVYKDGKVLPDGKNSRLRMLLSQLKTNTRLCSIDGASSTLLEYYYEKCVKKGYSDLVLIGHPKNATDASIRNLEKFISNHIEKDRFQTTKDIHHG